MFGGRLKDVDEKLLNKALFVGLVAISVMPFGQEYFYSAWLSGSKRLSG